MKEFALDPIDIGIMIVYVVGMVWYGLRHAKQQSSEDYFLAGRSMTWPIVGISLFAANIGSNTLIGLASDAYNTNVAVYNYEWMAAVVLVIFAIFFLPFYLSSKVYTMPEFLEKRYDSRSRFYFSFITIIGNIIIDTASGLYAGNLILKIIFPDLDSTVIVLLLAAAAAAYTIPGGLSSVVHTEVVQAVLLIISSIILTYFCLDAAGGWEAAIAKINEIRPEGKTADEALSLILPADDPHMPWTGLVFGVPILGFYFWANNQFMVQRTLSAKDLNHGRWGAIFAGLLKLPVLFFMVLPGFLAIAVFHDADISGLNYYPANGDELCTNLADCPNMTYPLLIYQLLPTGLLGLVIAGLLAAMSSSISATLNSASTLITMDFVVKAKPDLSSKQLVRAGQIATLVLVILAALWAPQIDRFGSLFAYLQIVLGLIAPPIVAVFVLGLFWTRANGHGAIASLLFGFVVSAVIIYADFTDSISWLNEIHFLHKAPLLMLLCMLVHAAVSLATVPPAADKVDGMTWNMEIFEADSKALEGLPWYKNFRVLAILLLLLTAFIVVYFW